MSCSRRPIVSAARPPISDAGKRAWLLFDGAAASRYASLAAKVHAGSATCAPSLSELARLLRSTGGIDGTLDRFNGSARRGTYDDFFRGDNEWDRTWGDPTHVPNPCLGPLDEPPYYAVGVVVGALATRGGIRVNGRAEAWTPPGW